MKCDVSSYWIRSKRNIWVSNEHYFKHLLVGLSLSAWNISIVSVNSKGKLKCCKFTFKFFQTCIYIFLKRGKKLIIQENLNFYTRWPQRPEMQRNRFRFDGFPRFFIFAISPFKCLAPSFLIKSAFYQNKMFKLLQLAVHYATYNIVWNTLYIN